MKKEFRNNEISLTDLLGFIFKKWILVLVLLLIGAFIAAGFAIINNKGNNVKEITNETIEAQKANLNSDQVEQVEYLFSQYLSYKEYRSTIQKYMADSLYASDDLESTIACTVIYYIESKIENVSQVFTRVAIGENEYIKIADILGIESTKTDDIYRRVSLTDITGEMGISGENNSNNVIIAEKNQNGAQNSLLQLQVVAKDSEQAEALVGIVEQAFYEEVEILRGFDSDIRLSLVDKTITTDVSTFFSRRQETAVTRLNNINTQLAALQTNYIDKLTPDEKNYFNILKDKSEETIAITKKISLKKAIVIGAAIGIIIAVLIIVLMYIFAGRVRATDDISLRYGIDAPYVIYKKKPQLFGFIVRKLREIDFSDMAIRQQMVASDIGIKLKKDEANQVYLVLDAVSQWETDIANSLKRELEESKSTLKINVGNPLSSPEELEQFSGAEAVLIMAQIDESKQKIVDKWIQLANRYNLNVIGAVILQES